MSNARSLIGGLFGRNLRSAARGRTRPRRSRDNHRWQVPAEISSLEQRCLLSGAAHGGAHHHGKSATAQSGNPVLINFAGYQWDANYSWSKDSGPYLNGQFWSPKNAVVEPDGLHLMIQNQQFSGQTHLASAEVDLVATSNGQPFNPGYGTYLVNVNTGNGQSFNQWTQNQNAIFGAFTYENLHGVGKISANGHSITGLPMSVISTLKQGMSVTGNDYQGKAIFHQNTAIQSIVGDTVKLTKAAARGEGYEHTIYFHDTTLTNQQRELDTMELSRFGNPQDPTNAQFTLQPYGDDPANVHRITLNDQGQITLVMKWTGPNQPVTFSEYNGTFGLNDLPANPTITWTTSTSQNQFIPNSYHQTFHLNLWQSVWVGQAQPTQVVVTNFQYAPLT